MKKIILIVCAASLGFLLILVPTVAAAAVVAAPIEAVTDTIVNFFNTLGDLDYVTVFGCSHEQFSQYEETWQKEDLKKILSYSTDQYGYKYEAAAAALFYRADHGGNSVVYDSNRSWDSYMDLFKGAYSSSNKDKWLTDTVAYLDWKINDDVDDDGAADVYNCLHRLAEQMRMAASVSTSSGISGSVTQAEIQALGDDIFFPGASSQCNDWWSRIHTDIHANNLTYYADDPTTCTNFAHWRFWLQYGADAGNGNGDQMAANTVALYSGQYQLVSFPVAGSIYSVMGYNHVGFIERVADGYVWFSDGNVAGGGIRFNTKRTIASFLQETGGIRCAAPIK